MGRGFEHHCPHPYSHVGVGAAEQVVLITLAGVDEVVATLVVGLDVVLLVVGEFELDVLDVDTEEVVDAVDVEEIVLPVELVLDDVADELVLEDVAEDDDAEFITCGGG
ncbi:hypothetical protein MMC09_002011 [Bachmanniomyces sp. S44760]|nr:hypothetical protein [Bachmanniomyces sp. S44760]